jgi:hypothetical protein
VDVPDVRSTFLRSAPEYLLVLGNLTGILSPYRQSFATISVVLDALSGFGIQFPTRAGTLVPYANHDEKPGLMIAFDGDCIIHEVKPYTPTMFGPLDSGTRDEHQGARLAIIFRLRLAKSIVIRCGLSIADLERRILECCRRILGINHSSCSAIATDWSAIEALVALRSGLPRVIHVGGFK